MALEQITFNLGALDDAANSGKNYVSGQVFEVFNIDDTYADIFADSAGTIPIDQSGIQNISNSDGECKFFIDKGFYNIKSGGKTRQLNANFSFEFETVSDAINARFISLLEGRRVFIVERGAYFQIVLTSSVNDLGPNVIVSLSNNSYSLLLADDVNPISLGGTYDGTFDLSPIIQWMVDNDYSVFLDLKETESIGMSYPVLIYGHAGLTVAAKSINTKIVPLSDMVFDSDRLDGLGLELQTEYNGKQCCFMIAEYDGENDRPNFAARDYEFKNLTLDSTGTAWENEISLVSTPHHSHTNYKYCRQIRSAYVVDPWLLSNDRSRHYHLEFHKLRAIKGLGCVNNEYLNSSATSYGTTWSFVDCSAENSRQGYQLYGCNYSKLDACSVDNNLKGTYALDIFDSQVEISAVGVENRLDRIAGDSGGGVFKIENSDVVINSLVAFSGDIDGNSSTGQPITDYDDGSGYVSESLMVVIDSKVTINRFQGSVPKEPGGDQWPLIVRGGSEVEISIGDYRSSNWWFNPNLVTVEDTSIVTFKRDDGTKVVLLGPDRDSFLEYQNVVATGADTKTFDGSASNSFNDYDRTNTARVALGALSLPDWTTLGLPDATKNPFGILEVKRSGSYIMQDFMYTQNRGRYQRMSLDSGSTWQAWEEIYAGV